MVLLLFVLKPELKTLDLRVLRKENRVTNKEYTLYISQRLQERQI